MILGLLAVAASATPEQDAEVKRVHDEMERLAQKNAWTGVERLYGELVAMEVPLAADVHVFAAQAARSEGKVTLEYLRLRRMVEPPISEVSSRAAWETGQGELAALNERFRWVFLHVGEPAEATLVRPAEPFAQLEKDAIQRAREDIAATRTFKGLLPLGEYVVGGTTVVVEAGAGYQVVAIGM